MPINNITQTISELPAAGRRGVDVQTIFVTKQEDFQDHLQGITVVELNALVTQQNTMAGAMNSTATQVNTNANTATTKAGEASTSASNALSSANTATTQAGIATNAATKASQWADNAYNVEVETGKYSAKHWSTVAQNATSGKIDKVTSTDNAIVRFDGTTGEVQDSSVTIYDNGSILTCNSTVVGVQYMTRYDVNNYALIRNNNVVNTIPIFETAVAGARTSAILANGNFQSATNVYGSTSDIKLKENVVDATPKLDKLMNVKVKNFNYIGQEDKQIGVIAQEIEEVFPSVVFETKDTKQVEVTKERIIPAVDEIIDAEGNIIQEAKPESIEEYTETETQETGEVTKNVKYSVLYMIAIKALQELNAKVEAMQLEINELKGAN